MFLDTNGDLSDFLMGLASPELVMLDGVFRGQGFLVLWFVERV